MSYETPERIQRISVPALDEILGKDFPVLDDGFVRIIDYMGDESAVVQAARVSYGAGTKKVSEDVGLLRYLMRMQHGTPFEMCSLKLHIRIPMDAWRQMVRHRTAKINEYSTRYSEAIDSRQTTEPEGWRLQGVGNRQGSFGVVTQWPEKLTPMASVRKDNGMAPGEFLSWREEQFHNAAHTVYKERLDMGVAREVARKDLPLSTYTEAYWKMDLRNLLGFLGLRMDSHAQKEIRDYADVIGDEIVARWVPEIWKAFNCYHPLRGAQALSLLDVNTINHFVTRSAKQHEPSIILLKDLPEEWAGIGKKTRKLKRNRERDEFEAKANRLGYKCFFTRPDGTAIDFGNVTRDTLAAHLAAGGSDDPWGDELNDAYASFGKQSG